MAYFKIGNTDYSSYVSSLKVSKACNYNAQTNAGGDTVVDYINAKKTIEVGIIALNDTIMAQLLTAIDGFSVSITYLEPKTNALVTLSCIIPQDNVSYYTIQTAKTSYKAFTLKFIQL